MFDDMHLVWIGLASTAATFLCGAIVLSMLQFASPERDDSLAADDRGHAARRRVRPESARGSTASCSVPSTVPERRRIAGDARPADLRDEELMLALSAVVTREGRVARAVRCSANDDIARRSSARSSMRSPAAASSRRSLGAAPVAVNLVWLLAHTTVRGKRHARSDALARFGRGFVGSGVAACT